MSDSNNVYLRRWMSKPLHCPFCGQKIFPTPYDEIPGKNACDHQLFDLSEGTLWFVAQEFLDVVEKLHGLPQELSDGDSNCFIESSDVETLDGIYSATALANEVVEYFKSTDMPVITYQIDIGNDLVTQAFIAHPYTECEA